MEETPIELGSCSAPCVPVESVLCGEWTDTVMAEVETPWSDYWSHGESNGALPSSVTP